MARQTINLGVHSFGSTAEIPIADRPLINPSLVMGGEVAYLGTLRKSEFTGLGGESITEIHTELLGGTSGPDLIALWESSAVAITLQNEGAGNIIIPGPNHTSSIVQDSLEPYRFTPQNWEALDSWIGNLSGNTTLILDDNDPSNPLDPDPPDPSDPTFPVDAGDVSWAFDLPQPTVFHTEPAAPTTAFTRDSTLDIALGTGFWYGGASDGTTLWFVENLANQARAYVAATRARDSAKDIALGTGNWEGGVSDGTTLWFVENLADQAIAYVAATRALDSAKDIALGSGAWSGGLSDGITLWFVDVTANQARAYVAATRARDSAKDIALGTGEWQGGLSDGITLWFTRGGSDDEIIAYLASDQSRQAADDITHADLAGSLFGGVYANGVAWFVEPDADTAIAFRQDPPDASAPSVTIDAIANHNEGGTVTLGATLTGGTYDTVDYLWSIDSGGGSIDDPTAETPVYTDPDVSFNTSVTLRLTITANGTGTNAAEGTSDTASDTEQFAVFFVADIPDATAPTVAIAPIGTVEEGATQALTATLTGGTYDALAYLWEVVSGGGTISNSTSASATYNAPAVTSDESVQVRLTVTATGTGTNAADGTSDDGIDFESFTVEDVPAVVTTDTDRIYTLGEVEPGRPTGGETQENHLPAGGWSRTAQEPTELAAVYTSARTRTFTNGVFTSALLWGPVTVHLPRLLALSDYATPSGYTDDFVALIEAEVAGGGAIFRTSAPTLGALLDGDLALDGADITIRVVQRRDTGATLRLVRDGADSLATEFQTGGGYAEARITIQTVSDTISLDVADDLSGTPLDNRADFSIAAGDQAAFNAIDTGERFILAIARPSTATQDHAVDAGDAAWAFDLPQPTVTHTPFAPVTTDHAVNAGALAWAFALPEPTVTHTSATPSGVVSVTVPLTGVSVLPNYIRWSDNYSLGSLFSADGAEQILSLVDLNSSGPAGRVVISISGINNRFTPAFEASGQIIFEASDGETLEVTIGNADMSEIYQWTPANSIEVVAFVDHIRTLTDQTGTITLRGEGEGVTDHAVNAGDASWAFAVPEPTVTLTPFAPVTTDHAVNAGDAAFAFSVGEPSVTHTPFVPNVFTVDAGNVGFAFQVSQPDVTHTTIIPQNYMRDAGNAAFAFHLPQPTVTHTTVAPQDHAVDAGALSWAFALPQPTVTHVPFTPATQDHAVNAGSLSWAFDLPEPTITFTPATGTGLGMYRFLAAQDPALIAQVLDSVNGQGAMVGIGALGSETLKCLVQEIRPLNELAAQVKLVPLGNDIHAAETGPLPPYDPRIAIPGAGSEFSARLLLQAFESAQAANGADGAGYEAIYRRTSDNTAPAAPTTTTAQREMNRFVPTGWTDNPGGPSPTMPFEWISLRIGTSGAWGEFSAPVLWAHYGADGRGVEYIFRRTATATAPPGPLTTSDQDETDEHLPTNWTDNPVGPSFALPFEWVSSRRGTTANWGKFSAPAQWSRYGADGMGFEFIFRTTATDSVPARPTTTTAQDQTDDHIPTGWTDDPTGVGAAMPYEWSCVRVGTSGNWGKFRSVRLHSRFGPDGADGRGFEHIFRRTSTDSRPSTPVGDQTVDDDIPNNWTDDPRGPNASLPFEWIASRSGTTGAWGLFSQPGLFSLYARDGNDGADGRGFEHIFRRTSTDSRPTTPTGDQTVDDSVPTGWTDDPTGPTASLPFEWIASRSGTTGAWGLFSQPGLFSLYGEPIDLGGTPLAPTLSVSAGGGRRAGYLFRVDIGFGGALNQKGIRKCQLQIDASSSFTTPINVDVELPRPPNAQWFTLHGFQRWYFRARVYNEPADAWSSWSTTRDSIGAFAEEDSGLPGVIKNMSVSAPDTANLVSVQFEEPATNSRTIWGYEIQARDPGFSPQFGANIRFTLGASISLTPSNFVGSFTAGSNVFSVSNSNFAVNTYAGDNLYIYASANTTTGEVRYPSAYPIVSNTSNTITLDTSETYGLPNYPTPVGGWKWGIVQEWKTFEDFFEIFDRAHPVVQTPEGPTHPDQQFFTFKYSISNTAVWRVRAKNQFGFGAWLYWDGSDGSTSATAAAEVTPTAIQVPEEITVQSIAKVTAQTDIQILDDVDLDDNELMNARVLETKQMTSTTVDSFQSAFPNHNDIRVMCRINLDGNDLYNIDDMEVDQLQSGHTQIAFQSQIDMVSNDIVGVDEIQARTFTDLP